MPPPPEELLAHEAFLRSFARKLLYDSHEADDLVQETLLVALRSAPASDRSLRSWLARVAFNLAIDVKRRRIRRRTSESSNARRDVEPPVADVAEEDAVRRSVVRAVDALREPYRTTLLLHYFDRMPPRRVASTLGVPVETVRTRIKRGLALVRAELDAVHGGNGRGWIVALLPLAGAPPRWLLFARRIRLRHRPALAAAILGAACVVLAWLAIRAAPGVERAAPVTVVAAASSSLPKEILAAPATPRLDASVPPRTLRVVRREDGERVAGASVHAAWSTSSVTDVVTDEEGRASIRGVGADELHVHVDGTERSLAADLVLSGGDAQESLVEVPAASTVRGRVVDSNGCAVRGATVRAWAGTELRIVDGVAPNADQETTTDADGAYRFGGLGAEFWVAASAPGLVGSMGLQGQPRSPRDLAGVDFTVVAPRTILGRVTRADGTPIAGADVVVRGGRAAKNHIVVGPDPDCPYVAETPLATRTSADGSFRIDGSPPIARRVVASHPGFKHQILSAPESQAELNFVLLPQTDLEVRVVDNEDHPVAGAAVHYNVIAAAASVVRTNDAGLARFARAPRGNPEFLKVEAPGFATESRVWRLGAGASSSVLIRLAPERPLSVRVVDTDARTAVRSRIEIRRRRVSTETLGNSYRLMSDTRSLHVLSEGDTDEHGAFHAAGLPEAELELQVQPLDRPACAEFFDVDADATSIELRLDRGSRPLHVVEGRIVDAAADHDRRAPREVLVTALERVPPMRLVRGVVDSDARYRVALPNVGPWLLIFQADDRALTSMEAEFPARSTRADVEMHARCDLHLRIVDSRLAPIGRGLVFVTDAAGHPIPLNVSRSTWLSNSLVDSAGEAVLEGLPEAEVHLTLLRDGVFPVEHLSLDLRRIPPGIFEWKVEQDASPMPPRVVQIAVARPSPSENADDPDSPEARARAALASYALRLSDADGREILAWRLQCGGPSPVLVPGMRVRSFHVDPDGRVSLVWEEDACDRTGLIDRDAATSPADPRALRLRVTGRAARLEITGEGIEPVNVDLRQGVGQGERPVVLISIQKKRS